MMVMLTEGVRRMIADGLREGSPLVALMLTDNGAGPIETEMMGAYLRHYTSKLENAASGENTASNVLALKFG